MRLAIPSLFLLVLAATAHAADGIPAPAHPGLMSGFPPPPEERVTRSNFMATPYSRWGFQHIRELQPTREVYRGGGAVTPLTEERLELDSVSATVREGRKLGLGQFLEESHTDAFLVLHRGKLVYERYMNGMHRHAQHQMFSVTKSFVGTLMLALMEQGKVDPAREVAHYVPELRDSAFGDATVQQVLDMTTAIDYTEIYDDPRSDVRRYGWVFHVWGDPPAGYGGPMTSYDYLPTLKKKGTHGHGFHYVTPNADVLGWVISRVTGKSVARNLEEALWQRLGVERDGYFWLDGAGTEMAGGGLNITARDAARFGQMLPPRVAERILQPGNPETFTRYYPDDPWYGTVAYAYHDQWWTFNNAHKAVSAIGVHGQYLYLDARAEMVVVKQSSSPDAEGGANQTNDVDGPLLYQALAEHLMARSLRGAGSSGAAPVSARKSGG